MRIAVVIPTLHEAARVQEAIRSAQADPPLRDQRDRRDRRDERDRCHERAGAVAVRVDVLISDGGSRDETCDLARALGARVVSSPPGRALQLQTGFEAAREADVVLFLHADTILPPGWAAAVERALRDPAVIGGAFALRFHEDGPAERLVAWGVRARVRWLGLPFGDQALFARRAALAALGGVPQVPIMEDVDLVRALRRRGRLAFLPLAVRTSARRYREHGFARTVARNAAALLGDALGVDRARIARWVRG